jgi:hypothetical protein
MRKMAGNELSETSEDMLDIRAEIRRGTERIDAMLREMEEESRRRSAETDALIARWEAANRESRIFRQELRKRIDRLPPAQAT